MKLHNKFFTLLVIGFLAVCSASPMAYARQKQSTSDITLQKAKQGDEHGYGAIYPCAGLNCAIVPATVWRIY